MQIWRTTQSVYRSRKQSRQKKHTHTNEVALPSYETQKRTLTYKVGPRQISFEQSRCQENRQKGKQTRRTNQEKKETQLLKKVQEHSGSKEASSDRGGGEKNKRSEKKLGRRELEGRRAGSWRTGQKKRKEAAGATTTGGEKCRAGKRRSSAAGCNCAVKLNRKAVAENSPIPQCTYLEATFFLRVPFFFFWEFLKI